MKYDNQQDLLEFLREIDARLHKERTHSKTTVYIFGGAAIVVGYNAPHATMDLDVLFEEKDTEVKLLAWAGRGSALEKKYGLYLQKANTELMPIEYPQWRDRSIEVLKNVFKNLRIMVPGKEDLILSKLGRYSDKDRADIQFMLKKFKIDPKKLTSYYKSARQYYVCNLPSLDLTFNIILKEHFNLKPTQFNS